MKILSKINKDIFMVSYDRYVTQEAYERRDFRNTYDIKLIAPGLSPSEMSKLRMHFKKYEAEKEM